jgi:hypothetical protein
MTLPLPLPCRRCHHDDDQHEPEPPDPAVLCPCLVDGCDCDDYEGDD